MIKSDFLDFTHDPKDIITYSKPGQEFIDKEKKKEYDPFEELSFI